MNDSIASVVVIVPKKECELDKDYLDHMGIGVLLVVIMLLIFAYITRKM